MPPARLGVRMDSLLPFLQGFFLPYNMPVYPGALRIGGDPLRTRAVGVFLFGLVNEPNGDFATANLLSRL
jgi:hypothetical protein